MALDLEALDVKKKSEEGSRLYFKHPNGTGEEMTCFMDVLGKDSSVFIDHQHEQLLKRANKKVTKKEVNEDDLERIEEEQIDLLTEMVVGLGDHEETKSKTKKGKELDYIIFKGENLTYSKKNVKLLLTTFPWMREQVAVFIGDRANFL